MASSMEQRALFTQVCPPLRLLAFLLLYALIN